MSTQLLEVLTTGINESMTPRSNLENCPDFKKVYFEIGINSVPYTMNAALNVPLAVIATTANILVVGNSENSYALAVEAFALHPCSDRPWNRLDRATTVRCASYRESEKVFWCSLFHQGLLYDCWICINRYVSYDYDRNKFGQVHRLLFPSQVP